MISDGSSAVRRYLARMPVPLFFFCFSLTTRARDGGPNVTCHDDWAIHRYFTPQPAVIKIFNDEVTVWSHIRF